MFYSSARATPRHQKYLIDLSADTRSRASAPEERRNWRDDIYDQIRKLMSLQGSLSIERMCELTRLSRASLLPFLSGAAPGRRGDGSAIGDSADCRRTSSALRVPPNCSRIATARHAGESQTGHAAHGRGRPARVRVRAFVVTRTWR